MTVDRSSCDKPAYPATSRRYEEQGEVVLKFLIDTDGTVLESEIVRSSGFPLLDEAARVGLAKCRFHPGKLDGEPQKSWANVKYVWTLN